MLKVNCVAFSKLILMIKTKIKMGGTKLYSSTLSTLLPRIFSETSFVFPYCVKFMHLGFSKER